MRLRPARVPMRAAADNALTVLIGPDKKLKLTITYPASTVRNFKEILRVIDSLQLAARHGVATQSPARQRGLVVEDKAARVARFQKATLNALHDIVVACGLESPDEFSPDNFGQQISAIEMRTMDEVYHFVAAGELIDGARDERLAKWWKLADAASFSRRAV